jgi:phosphopantothenoylcysteine decarboxylase / phosphopantothenate---cysteine ligase
MASLTVRHLDENVKKQLRLLAAQNGVSMEEYVRIILSGASNPTLTSHITTGTHISHKELDTTLQRSPSNGSPQKNASTLSQSLLKKRILLIIGGGIAAYKTPELVRNIIKRGGEVTCLLTKAAEQFVTPLTLASLSGNKVYTDLFSLTDEVEMGHIQLSRAADLIVIAPATADLIAKAANGLANDLASTVLLATDKPVLLAPAMNVRMWHHAATQRNVARLQNDGLFLIGPDEGDMACGEYGLGRMSEPHVIADEMCALLTPKNLPLKGIHVLVTSGPTFEPIDPVRFIGNHSSGKQGHAIAKAALEAGACVTLVSGPVNLPDPIGAKVVHVKTAQDMLNAVEVSLPADVVICAAAVADWSFAEQPKQKLKKTADDTLTLTFAQTPDILAHISQHPSKRPTLVIGFAAETEHVVSYAKQKRLKKGCDWIVANDVSEASGGVFGQDENTATLITSSDQIEWPRQSKQALANALIQQIILEIVDINIEKLTSSPSP